MTRRFFASTRSGLTVFREVNIADSCEEEYIIDEMHHELASIDRDIWHCGMVWAIMPANCALSQSVSEYARYTRLKGFNPVFDPRSMHLLKCGIAFQLAERYLH